MDKVAVKQALLKATTPAGRAYVFAILHDDRCAILCDGEAIHVGNGDRTGVDSAIAKYLKLINADGVGASQLKS